MLVDVRLILPGSLVVVPALLDNMGRPTEAAVVETHVLPGGAVRYLVGWFRSGDRKTALLDASEVRPHPERDA